MRTCLAAFATALAACAAIDPAPAGPSPFEGVHRVALVRHVDRRASPRPKDPLDALAESLGARGFETRLVEVGAGAPAEVRPLEALRAQVEARLAGGRLAGGPPGSFGPRVEHLGEDAASAVASAGVDAVVVYCRFAGARLGPTTALPPPPDAFGGPPRVVGRPVAALALVGRDGELRAFEWGGATEYVDSPGPTNAMEAIDALVAELTGEPPDA